MRSVERPLRGIAVPLPGRRSRTEGRTTTMPAHACRRPYVIRVAVALLIAAGLVPTPADLSEAQNGRVREFTVTAEDFRFDPAQLDVRQNDLVKITFNAPDLAHSFTIDEYRIAKRAPAGGRVTFEFRADRAGRFRIYCNLANHERCQELEGLLVVVP